MDSGKAASLQAAGFQIGSAAEFLEMSPAEEAMVETRLAITDALRARRKASKMSQVELARRLRSSQSRVAKIEAGDPSVSLDQLARAFLETGATREELAGVIASGMGK